jgi:AraC-like DNA-binding protein
VREETLASRRALYQQARLVVAREYRSGLTVELVAEMLSSSPRSLARAYAQAGECTFAEDLFQQRMSVAARLLVEQRSIAVADVGRLVGYRHGSHFARAFGRGFGVSPAVFRARSGEAKGASVLVSARPSVGLAALAGVPGCDGDAALADALGGLGSGQAQAHEGAAGAGRALGDDAAGLLGGDLADDREPEA